MLGGRTIGDRFAAWLGERPGGDAEVKPEEAFAHREEENTCEQDEGAEEAV